MYIFHLTAFRMRRTLVLLTPVSSAHCVADFGGDVLNLFKTIAEEAGLVAVRGLPDLPLCTSKMVPCVSNLSQSYVNIKRVGDCVWNSRFHWRLISATFSNFIYHFKMDFRFSNINRAPATFFHYHTSYVTWSYSHASSDICWENTILHIVMIIQFNFENNTQISSVKVFIHFFGWPCTYIYIYIYQNPHIRTRYLEITNPERQCRK